MKLVNDDGVACVVVCVYKDYVDLSVCMCSVHLICACCTRTTSDGQCLVMSFSAHSSAMGEYVCVCGAQTVHSTTHCSAVGKTHLAHALVHATPPCEYMPSMYARVCLRTYASVYSYDSYSMGVAVSARPLNVTVVDTPGQEEMVALRAHAYPNTVATRVVRRAHKCLGCGVVVFFTCRHDIVYECTTQVDA
jgi:hypothetical protein